MNAIEVTRYKDTIFVPLPEYAKRPIEGACSCDYCMERD